MKTLLSTVQLTKVFPQGDTARPILDGLDLEIGAAKFSVVMGASGSGKSTLLNLLGGLDRPTSGRIELLGHRIDNYDEAALAAFRRRHLGFVFQDHCLLAQLSLEENILLAGYLSQQDRRLVQQRTRKLLAQLGIAQLAKRLPGEVSGGESQRAAIARSLINSPELLLADEPTGNLNSNTSRAVLDIFADLACSGQSLLMATHDIPSAAYGDEIHYLEDGRLSDSLLLSGDADRASKADRILTWLRTKDF